MKREWKVFFLLDDRFLNKFFDVKVSFVVLIIFYFMIKVIMKRMIIK